MNTLVDELNKKVLNEVEIEKKSLKEATKKSCAGKISHKKTVIDGITFDSMLESEYYLYLKALKKYKLIKDFSLQPEFILQDKFIIVDNEVVNGNDERFNKLKRQTKAETIRAIKYRGDFLITDLNDTQRVVDTKGFSTKEFEIKRKMFMCKYPGIKLEVLIKRKAGWIDYYENQKNIKNKKKAKKAQSV